MKPLIPPIRLVFYVSAPTGQSMVFIADLFPLLPRLNKYFTILSKSVSMSHVMYNILLYVQYVDTLANSVVKI